MDGGAWWATVYGVAKSQTRLSGFTFFHFQVQAAQVTRCLASAVAAQLSASPVPAALFSGCTIGAPSQAHVDSSESQEQGSLAGHSPWGCK